MKEGKKQIYAATTNIDPIFDPYTDKIGRKVYPRKVRLYSLFTSDKEHIDLIKDVYGHSEYFNIGIETIDVNEDAIGFLCFNLIRFVIINENECCEVIDTQFVEFYSKDDVIKFPFNEKPNIKTRGIYNVKYIDDNTSELIPVNEIDYDKINSMNTIYNMAIDNGTYNIQNDSDIYSIYGNINNDFVDSDDIIEKYNQVKDATDSDIVEAIYFVYYF